ncbi:hypothetical protein K1W54_01015 [Micromonospora sp. CPCC 205371]|nr:hypothetical protein [Micromonospora sp. CPCC 205371]
MVPLFALAIGPSAKEGIDRLNNIETYRPIAASADGWADFAGVRIKLVEVTPTTDAKTFGGDPFVLPDGLTLWRVTLTIEAPSTKALAGCAVKLEDKEGRIYGSDPSEVDGARLPYPGCMPEDDEAPPPFQVVNYFVMPESASPAAVRVTRSSETPRYVRFSAGG